MNPTILLPDEATLYQAFVQRDASYEGLCVMAVRTTGIFCRPTCTARKPLRGNVEFFPRAGDALAAGYRACQRCRPLEPLAAPPSWLRPLLDAVDAQPLRRWTVQEITELGIDPARVRRWFQRHYGMTFIAYQRARRLGQAFSRIDDGASVLESALDADFDSLSGFCDAFRRATGTSPRDAARHRALQVMQTASPLGPIIIVGDAQGVYLAEFWDRRLLQSQFSKLERQFDAVFFPGETAAMRQFSEELAAYFRGELKRFATPLILGGTAAQEQVWRGLLKVPYGETCTYGQLAAAIGRPRAVRAVARAVGENRLAVALPCHRIIGSSGKLTGYGGGLWRKRFLLSLEGGREPGGI